MTGLSADQIKALLDLAPHPEGGWYRQTFSDVPVGGRPISTAIYYLLEGGIQTAWHRVDAAEVWHWYGGDRLMLSTTATGTGKSQQILGPDLAKGERPQIVIPPSTWQSAESLGAFTLIGCTVAPGFQFSRFEMKPKEWTPG